LTAQSFSNPIEIQILLSKESNLKAIEGIDRFSQSRLAHVAICDHENCAVMRFNFSNGFIFAECYGIRPQPAIGDRMFCCT